MCGVVVFAHHGAHVDVRGQHVGVGFFLPPCGFGVLNSSCQV